MMLAMLDLGLPLAFLDADLFTTAALISLLTLTLLEIILGIDNVVFIAILTGKLPEKDRAKARNIGLGLAAGMRVLMLFGATWVLTLDKPEYTVIDLTGWFGSEAVEVADAAPTVASDPATTPTSPTTSTAPSDAARTASPASVDESHQDEGEHIPGLITWKDLIILLGGLFLLAKATYEIHDKLEGNDHAVGAGKAVTSSFAAIIVQILLLDLVFSIDSVITAVGIADHLEIMVVAVLVAVIVMVAFAGPISRFVEKHPTMKILALSFLILIGVMLVAEGFEQAIPKGYIYFSMAFALVVEMLNIRLKKISKPVKLRQSYVESTSSDGYGDLARAKQGRGLTVHPTAGGSDTPPTT